jgi:hypothetical protein
MEKCGKRWIEVRDKVPNVRREVQAWQAQEWNARRPCSLDEYCAAHGVSVCANCQGMGFQIVSFEWDDHAGDEQSGEMVPLYGVCQRCGGSGR